MNDATPVMTNSPNIISDHLMGEVWPTVQPGRGPSDLGSVRLEPSVPVRVRSMQTLKLVYTVGRFGLDDTGGLKVVQRFTNDGGRWQTNDPAAMNYVTAFASNGVGLDIEIERNGHQRPWDRSMCITVCRGHMKQGDTITIVLGDRSQGGPGLRMPTFCESAHEFRVLVDVCATRQFLPLQQRPAVEILPETPRTWRVLLPGLRRPGAKFSLGLRADDLWGNPSDMVEGTFRLTASGPVEGLPQTVTFHRGQRALRIDGLTAAAPGVIRVALSDDEGNVLVLSNPLVVREGEYEGFWGDLHGQSGETVGINPIQEYFEFGRDLALLDVMSHQANDFQVKNVFWNQINAVTAEFDAPGKFVAFPGYEWSGNTPTGGDHNVFFRHEGRPMVRSSHAMLQDRNDLIRDANTTAELFEALKDEDCVLYAHVGGRPADIGQADGGALRTAVEVHSDWGTFEWIMADSFKLGYRHGLVCNSDGHKGRPGASHPGASSFGALGGLTCFFARELSRDGIFEAMRRRHHYGTTGGRLHLDVTAAFASPARLFETDPRLGDARFGQAETAMMGDIVAVREDRFEVSVSAVTQSPLLSIDILRGTEVLKTVRPYGEDVLGPRYRVCFHGAEYRGRGRQTNWKGHARLDGAHIERFETVNAWNHDRLLRPSADDRVEFDVLTTGNFVGFDIWLNDVAGGIEIVTGHVSGKIDLASVGIDPVVLEAGGLDRKVTLQRLPDTLSVTALEASADIVLDKNGDTPVWARVATEDGHLAWSSPIYAFRDT
ncbi:DUF3604 domain-containing protein [uncultured Roseibium sp.]|uniref:DUF3604 domain-containing protein n=1 Tax=uncultured Roseibium sp. TaxID=1936171 RepID=UPI0032176B1B